MVSRRKHRQALALTLFGVALSATALIIGQYLPPERGEMGVIFPPWVDQRDAIEAIIFAGGSITGTGRFSNILIAFGPDEGFSRRVTAAGALFVTAASGLCGPVEETQA